MLGNGSVKVVLTRSCTVPCLVVASQLADVRARVKDASQAIFLRKVFR